MATAYRMATEFARDVWLDGMRAQLEAPNLADQMVAAGLISWPALTARRYNTGSAAVSDFIDSVYRHDPRLSGPDRNPYGAHRYPRLGMMSKRKPPAGSGALDWDWYDL